MLQQTRVATVIPYFERFVARFPTVEALAGAAVEEVLGCWSGLGYYRRARALHAAARAIVAEHGGWFPDTIEGALGLPGVGRYTAGAVLSIAYGRCEPVVDGNVARVLARVFGIEGHAGAGAFQEAVWSRARALVPEDRAGDWNQALMELGALVCTPREPRCTVCPLAQDCSALREQRVAELPWPKARPEPIDVALTVAVVVGGNRVLLERRPAGGRMAELWQLPTIERVAAGDTARLHPERWPAIELRAGERKRALRAGRGAALGVVRHTITRHRIRARVVRGELGVGRGSRLPDRWAWFDADELGDLALTGLSKKVIAAPFFPRLWSRSSAGA